MKRGLFLLILLMTVVATSVACWKPGEGAQTVAEHKPVIVPYLNIDIKTVPVATETHENTSVLACIGEFEQIPTEEENTPEWTYYGECRITHYDDCAECCGVAGNTTASGIYPTANHTVAAGYGLEFGTEVLINGQVYIVEDRGVDDGCFDIFVDDHETAVQMGMYYTDVYVR